MNEAGPGNWCFFALRRQMFFNTEFENHANMKTQSRFCRNCIATTETNQLNTRTSYNEIQEITVIFQITVSDILHRRAIAMFSLSKLFQHTS